jgi:hypothetical protein
VAKGPKALWSLTTWCFTASKRDSWNLGKDVKKLRALEFKVDDAFNRNHLPK